MTASREDSGSGDGGGSARDEALLEDSAEDLYENAPCGYLSAYPDGPIARVNQTFLTWTGYRRDDLVGQRRFLDLLTPGGRIFHETHYAPLLRMQGSVRAIAMDVVRADGTRMPVLINSRMRTSPDGQPLAVRTTVFDATDRKQYETELLAARRRAEQATTWVRALELAVAELAAVSGVAEVCDSVARAATTAFGAVSSAVWTGDLGGGPLTWRAAAGAAGAPLDLPLSGELRGENDALRAGQVMEIPEGADQRVVELSQTLGGGAGHLVLAPLVAHDRTLGVIGLRLPNHAPAAEELRLLQTLGQQAGQALERARLGDEQRRVATTLQHSLLASDLPDDPRLGLSACYRPAVHGLEVGGDWYDAFLLDADRVAVVVGDVVGRGLQAAAVMGQLRSAVRALATVDAGPATLLERLDRFVEGVPAADTATMAYAEVDLRTGEARYACAGHPPPIVVDAAGATTLLWEGRSAPLGAHFGVDRRPEATEVLSAGARLVLYTDGLVERRDRALDQGIDALAEVLGSRASQPLIGVADSIVDTVLGAGRTGDDVCLLALAYGEHPTFTCTVPAAAAQVSQLRAELRSWLQSHGMIGDDQDATVLAASETVSNAIEHGYADQPPGVVDVLASLRPGQIRMRVRDDGRWRAPRSPGDRGRGLHLVRRLMDEVMVDHRSGTVVTMCRTVSIAAPPGDTPGVPT